MDIATALTRIKNELEKSITTAEFNGELYDNGVAAKQALIRSQKLINYIHETVKSEVVKYGINPEKLYPKLNSTKPEITIQGLLKAKKQDICISPNPILEDGPEIEKVIIINVRSQLSSLQKNIDTLHERTFVKL